MLYFTVILFSAMQEDKEIDMEPVLEILKKYHSAFRNTTYIFWTSICICHGVMIKRHEEISQVKMFNLNLWKKQVMLLYYYELYT